MDTVNMNELIDRKVEAFGMCANLNTLQGKMLSEHFHELTQKAYRLGMGAGLEIAQSTHENPYAEIDKIDITKVPR